MALLALAVAFTLALHLLVDGTLREGLIARVGRASYLTVFYFLATVSLLALTQTYEPARDDPLNVVYWRPFWATTVLQLALELAAYLLVVCGLLTRPAQRASELSGVRRITRYPVLWGSALWALAHAVAHGESASFLLFGGLFVLFVLRAVLLDLKRLKARNPEWDELARQASSIPFAAVVEGRQQLDLREFGWWRILAALSAYAVTLALHEILTGAQPF